MRLLPSPYATAVEANRAYLLQLSPDRLLHNFMTFAGLPAKGEVYGGWEGDTIAGHTLGHYLSALVVMYQQTGDAESAATAQTTSFPNWPAPRPSAPRAMSAPCSASEKDG
ncbi:beta-L-arabinofuranosidase domain-containing protein [Caulobacter segnis]